LAQLSSDQQTIIRQALFSEGELSWLLHSSQKEVYEALRALPKSTRQCSVLIARRWGKSFLASVLAIEDCLRNPNAQVFYVAPTMKQCSSIVTPLLLEIAAYAPKGLMTRAKSEYRWNFSNGSTLILGGFDTSNESFRGLKATSIYCDESGSADASVFMYTIRDVFLPTLLHSRGRIVHLTTPSPLPSHPFHDEIVPGCELKSAHWVKTIYDNPLIDAQTISEFMAEMGGEQSVAWKREFLCERAVETSSLVIPEFDEALHVSDTPIGPSNWLMAGDMGGSRDKTVGLLVAYDWNTATTFFLDECVFDANTNTRDIVKGLRAIEALAPIQPPRVIDAPGQLLVDLRQTFDYACQLPNKDNADAALNNLRAGIAEGKVRVHPRCKFLITTLKNATFNKNRTDFARSEALGHCDAIDAAAYGYRMVNRYSNPFPALVVGIGQWQRTQARANDGLAKAINPWIAKKGKR